MTATITDVIDSDVIDSLAGIKSGGAMDAIRARRPEARTHAQTSYRTLFAPELPSGVSLHERFAVASFVAGLHGRAETVAFYADGLAGSGASSALCAAVQSEIALAAASGPYGSYPAGPLSAENTAGPVHRVANANRAILGPRLSGAFEHTHMLLLHPRDSAPRWLQALVDAGWTTTDIVTLSQLVAFLSFQIRVIAGLRTLAATI